MLIPQTTHARVFLAAAAFFGLVAVASSTAWRPLNVHTGYAPEQPIAYSHRLHAGELGIDCLFCHYGARNSRHAGIPPTSVCMNCHATLSTNFDALLEERALAQDEDREPRRLVSDEILKIYAAMGLDADLEPTPEGPRPIPWVRVHNLPDFVAFNHSVHVARDIACESCHGPVQAMERVRQESDLSMGWCVNCHRENGLEPHMGTGSPGERLDPSEQVSTDCSVCHY
ncbi:MAG: hypothetical protein DRQ55_03405 [Planctomycetota bacterium]|nr:MAG: hypothetical protein DRQ55_03405 [Planctomycetota bacterium]